MNRLFIENQEVELDKDVLFAITKQFEQLQNPTVICNSWSKTVSIPFTQKNNEIFGHIYDADRLTVAKKRNLIEGVTPPYYKVWNGSSYVNGSLTSGNIVYNGAVEYLRVSNTDGSNVITKQIFNLDNANHVFKFLYDSSTRYIEISLFNPNSTATNGEVCYVDWRLDALGISVGKVYALYFTVNKLNDTITISDIRLESEGTSVVDIFDNLPVVRQSGLSYNPNNRTIRPLIQPAQWNNTEFQVRLYRGDVMVTATHVTSTGVGSLTTVTKSSAWDRIGFAFQDSNYSYELLYDASCLADGGYSLGYRVVGLSRTGVGTFDEADHMYMVSGTTAYDWETLHPYTPTSFTGIYFDPLRKLDFRLLWGDAILMTGYAKMNEVKQQDGKGTYELTLFGELGKVLGEMKKITFNKASQDVDYIIQGEQYVDTQITKDIVKSSWRSTGQTTDILLSKDAIRYNLTDIIGFAPNNSFSDNFDYTSSEKYGEVNKFTDILGESFTEDTNLNPDSVIPNGLMPRDIGEYRSYNQIPYIYFNKLFRIFQQKAEDVTGYKFDLDNEWFSTANPYWYRLVYLLKPFDTGKGQAKNNTYQTDDIGYIWHSSGNTWTDLYTSSLVVKYESTTGNTTPVEQEAIVSTNTFSIPKDTDYVTFRLNYKAILTEFASHKTNLRNNNAICLTFKMTGSNGVVKQKKFMLGMSGFSGNTTGYQFVPLESDTTYLGYNCLSAQFTPCFVAYRDEVGASVTFSVVCTWYANSYPYGGTGTGNNYVNLILANNINRTTRYDFVTNCTIMRNSFHSKSRFILNDLWNNEFNLFNEIINYCKIYRIGIFVDEVDKKIKFMPIKKYFASYTVEDWTDKVDMSKDFAIKPVSFDTKYVMFNYKDSDTQLAKQYKDKTGVHYGDYRLITDYNFDNKTTNLFEGVQQSIVNTNNVQSWTNLYNRHSIEYSLPSEIYVYNRDADGKQKNTFGSYYFYSGRVSFDTQTKLHLRNVYITDDTDYQISTSNYSYIDIRNGMESVTNCTTYPKLDIVYGDNLVLFNTPTEDYTYIGSSHISGKNNIYTNFWKNYIEERYNPNNKVVTCYIRLTPMDYILFDFNKFVRIENQLYAVNKIYDYDVTSNEPTKIELVKISNINGYLQ